MQESMELKELGQQGHYYTDGGSSGSSLKAASHVIVVILFTFSLLAISLSLGLGIANPSGMLDHYVPGSHQVINVSRFYCGEIAITFEKLAGNQDLNASVYLIDNASNLTLINTLNFTYMQDEMNSIVLAPNKWYYFSHYLNQLSVVTIDACLAKGMIPAMFYIIKGDASFSKWSQSPHSSDNTVYQRTLYPCMDTSGNDSMTSSSSGNWLDASAQVEDDLTMAEKVRYEVEEDDSYYFVFFSLSTFDTDTVEAQLHFVYYSYSSGSADAACFSRRSELVCHLTIPHGNSKQSVLISTVSPNVLTYGSYMTVSWKCSKKGIPLVLVSCIPVLKLIFVSIPWCVYVIWKAIQGDTDNCCINTAKHIYLVLLVLIVLLGAGSITAVLPLTVKQSKSNFHIANFKAQDTHISTIDTHVCEGVHVSSSSPFINATVYLLDYQPELKQWSNFTLAKTKLLLPDVHIIWKYYLHEGSVFTLQSACLFYSFGSVYFSIIKEHDYPTWINDGDQTGVIQTTAITSRTCDKIGPLLNYTIAAGEDDQYFFVLYNNETNSSTSASVKMHFCRTEFTVNHSRNSTSCRIIANSQPSCLVTTSTTKSNMIGLIVSNQNMSKSLTYAQTSALSWKCQRRTWMWWTLGVSIFVLVTIIFLSVIFLYIRYVHKYC